MSLLDGKGTAAPKPGLIDTAAPPPPANKLLRDIEQRIEAGLTPENRADYLKIVVSGMRVAAHGGPAGLLSGLARRKDPVADAATGAINLVLLMSKQSQGTMPMKAMIPAAMTLMLQALDLIDKARIAKIDADSIGRATHVFTDHLFKVIGVTPQMLTNAAQKIHGITQDPAKMNVINLRTGAAKDPRAAPVVGAANGV